MDHARSASVTQIKKYVSGHPLRRGSTMYIFVPEKSIFTKSSIARFSGHLKVPMPSHISFIAQSS